MYIVTSHAKDPGAVHTQYVQQMSSARARELMANSSDFADAIPDLEVIARKNQDFKRIMSEKAVGRPGHYYGRDIIIEGAMPMPLFMAAATEYGGNADWWREDKLFDDYMTRHPEWDWRKY